MKKEIFIIRAKNNHNIYYDYSCLPEEFMAKDKIKIICFKHGMFEQNVNSHLRGANCKSCGYESSSKTKTKNLNWFIKKSIEKHKNKYDYEYSKYINSKSKIDIKCKIHNYIFSQEPTAHLNGQGCPKCKIDKNIANNSMSKDDFLIRANIKYNNLFTYDIDNYISGSKKIKITCVKHNFNFEKTPLFHLQYNSCRKCLTETLSYSKEELLKKFKIIHNNIYIYNNIDVKSKILKIYCNIHGEFEQKINKHLLGKGCIRCAARKNSDKSIEKARNNFKDKANKIHNNKYNYDNVNYINAKTNIEIICKNHDKFLQSPNAHLLGSGCPYCCKENRGLNQTSSKEYFITKAELIHKQNYEYSFVNYINSKIKVKIKCIIHNEIFIQTPNNHLNGKGCPKCRHNISKIEIKWLEFLKIPEKYRHKVIFINKKKI